jgi:hypothetical protein
MWHSIGGEIFSGNLFHARSVRNRARKETVEMRRFKTRWFSTFLNQLIARAYLLMTVPSTTRASWRFPISWGEITPDSVNSCAGDREFLGLSMELVFRYALKRFNLAVEPPNEQGKLVRVYFPGWLISLPKRWRHCTIFCTDGDKFVATDILAH